MDTNTANWHLRTAGGIPYRLVEGYPKGSFDEDDCKVEEKYIIQARDLMSFVTESLSDLQVRPGGQWFYRPARRLPGPAATTPYAVTQRVSFEPLDGTRPCDPFLADVPPPSSGTYGEFLTVTIEYLTGKSDDDWPGMVELSVTSASEFMVIPSKSLTFKTPEKNADGTAYVGPANPPVKDPKIPYTMLLPSLEWSVKFPRVPLAHWADSMALASDLLGCVNDRPMQVMVARWPETVLFVGFSLDLKWNWRQRQPCFSVELKFLQKEITESWDEALIADAWIATTPDPTGFIDGWEWWVKGHNHSYNPATSHWDRLRRPDDTPLYKLADLNQLFFGAANNPAGGGSTTVGFGSSSDNSP